MINYQQYKAQYGSMVENIGYALYDTLTYTSAVSTALSFFTTARALPFTVGNMRVASLLPAPQAFLVQAIRVAIIIPPFHIARAATTNVQTGAVNDMALLLNFGVLSFTIGNKNYGQWPLWTLPQGSGAISYIASDGDTADPGAVHQFTTNGKPSTYNVRVLSTPIFIPPQVNFDCLALWPAAQTLAAGNPLIQVTLDGQLFRQVQ